MTVPRYACSVDVDVLSTLHHNFAGRQELFMRAGVWAEERGCASFVTSLMNQTVRVAGLPAAPLAQYGTWMWDRVGNFYRPYAANRVEMAEFKLLSFSELAVPGLPPLVRSVDVGPSGAHWDMRPNPFASGGIVWVGLDHEPRDPDELVHYGPQWFACEPNDYHMAERNVTASSVF